MATRFRILGVRFSLTFSSTSGRASFSRIGLLANTMPRSVPSLWSGWREQILLDNKRGLEIHKNPAEGEAFFVDFSSYRGGLNGSTQHSAQNPHSLKTKAKSAG